MKMIRLLVIFCFIISIPSQLLAFDAYGWYVAINNAPNFPTYLKITETHFSGLPYKVMEEGKESMKISITNSKKTTNIEKKGDEICITTVRGKNILYRFLTDNISLTEEEVAKMGQSGK